MLQVQRAVETHLRLETIAVSETHTQVEWNTKNEILIGPMMNEQVLKNAIALLWPATLTAGRQTVTE